MKVRVFQSGKGDALLITSSKGRHILVDGGVPESYAGHWAETVGALRENQQPIELLCISHIDRDHIGGVLKMLDNEMAWRVFDYRSGLPAAIRSSRKPRKPKVSRPPQIRAIWHNAFFERARRRRASNRRNVTNAPDLADQLFRSAAIMAGGRDATQAGRLATQIANQLQFLGQSVGDAIEVSRRIGAQQLKIPHNRQYRGKFVTRSRRKHTIAGMEVKVLGPTTGDLRALEEEWNEWLTANAAYLKRLQDKHDDQAGGLRLGSVDAVLAAARESALALAGNQAVTPPNLASIIMLVRDGDDSILLTGDADDTSIVKGLKSAGELSSGKPCRVRVFKAPHHGAHNSYSNELARSVIADHYVFCGNGKHDNPEPEVLDGYLAVLLDGADGVGPAAPSGLVPTFWFNSGPALHERGSSLWEHWKKVESVIKSWQRRQPHRVRHKFLRSGDSFLVA